MKPQSKFSVFLEKQNWTTEQLAEQMGRPVATVKGWRSGRRVPQAPETREKLARVLGLTMRQLKRLLEG